MLASRYRCRYRYCLTWHRDITGFTGIILHTVDSVVLPVVDTTVPLQHLDNNQVHFVLL